MKMRFLKTILYSFLTSDLYAYIDTQQLPPSYVYNAGIPTSQESLPYNPASYDYQNIIISRQDSFGVDSYSGIDSYSGLDSYSGIDSYGVPVEEPILTTPLAPFVPDYYQYNTGTGTGVGESR